MTDDIIPLDEARRRKDEKDAGAPSGFVIPVSCPEN